jgi:ankyrin repeat domain-containing protein 50
LFASFRWLDCQLGELQKCATPAAVQKALDDLPASLEAYYTRVLESIDESKRELAKSLLRWLCFAFRPVSLYLLGSID